MRAFLPVVRGHGLPFKSHFVTSDAAVRGDPTSCEDMGGDDGREDDRKRTWLRGPLGAPISLDFRAVSLTSWSPTSIWCLRFARAGAFGCLLTIQWPTFQTLFPMALPADLLKSGVALASTSSNAARIVGPALAAPLLIWFGTGAEHPIGTAA